ncbi:MAG: NCS2 family permease [Candidatus Anstonellales archaeon]
MDGKSLKSEIAGGFTTFLAVSYALIIVPKILADAGIPFQDALAATAIASGVATIIMGLIANRPFAVAPSIALASFFTYTVVNGLHVSWQVALAAVFFEGLLFFGLSISKIRSWFGVGIPYNLKYAMIAGVGLFLAFLGMREGGIIVPDESMFVRMGSLFAPGPVITIMGFFIMAILLLKKVRGSLLWGILLTTAITIASGLSSLPTEMFSVPTQLSTFFALDIHGLMNASILSIVLAFFMVDFFDTLGAATALLVKTGDVNEKGHIKNIDKVMVSDSIGTTLGSVIGVPAQIVYLESAAGIQEGARTGIAAFIIGILLILSIFFYPIIEKIPMEAIAPALIIVGLLLATNIRHVDFSEFTEAIPSLLMLSAIPLSFSISHGIGIASIVYVVLKLCSGQYKNVHPAMYAIAALFLLDYLQVF